MIDDIHPPVSQRRILIVDDMAENLSIVDRHLRRHGYATELCNDGTSALKIVSHRMPDLVLLDWTMPGLSGLETLQALREHHDENLLPVIVCTAVGEETSAVSAIRAGANDFVMKPISFPILMARLKSQLLRKDAIDMLKRENSELEKTLVKRTRDLLNIKHDK